MVIVVELRRQCLETLQDNDVVSLADSRLIGHPARSALNSDDQDLGTAATRK